MTDNLIQEPIVSVDPELLVLDVEAPVTDAPESGTPVATEVAADAESLKVPMRVFNQLDSKGEDGDRADALELYRIFEGLTHFSDVAFGDTNKIARLAVQHLWQYGKSPYPRHSHNKPLDYPWSEHARNLYFEGKATGNLILEHVRPLGTLVESLFKIVREEGGEESIEKFYQKLIEEHSHLNFTVISNDDNDLLDKAGLRTKLVPGGPWARYEMVGLMREQFKSITEDERFSPDLIKGRRGRFVKPKKVRAKKTRVKKVAVAK